MARPPREEIASTLARVYIFQGTKPEDLLELGDLFEFTVHQQGELIPQSSTEFYIVHKGKVRITPRRGRKTGTPYYLGYAEFFGEDDLLGRQISKREVKCEEYCEFLILAPNKYPKLKNKLPDIEQTLSAIHSGRRLADKRSFSWLRQDEVVYYVTRKANAILIWSLLLPILLGMVALPLIALGLYRLASTSSDGKWYFGIGMALLVWAVVWGIWRYLDWANDYYIVTNLSVSWIEKIILLYDSRNQAPLETVQSVDLTTSWFGRRFNFGTVLSKTFTGTIPMVNTAKPYLMSSFIEGMRLRRLQFAQEEDVTSIRKAVNEALKKHLQPTLADKVPVIPAPPPAKPKDKKTEEKKHPLRFYISFRYEVDDSITYRKYWPVLLGKTWVPALLILFWLVIVIFVLLNDITRGSLGFWGPLLMVLGLAFMIWFIYNFQDWRNDKYQVTRDKILDLEKKPLGTEVKKTADLVNILSIEHEQRGLIGVLLNYGNVYITVGQVTFIFFGVRNPDRVHQDVFGKREELRLANLKNDAEKEKIRMINWLLSYYDETKGIDRETIIRTVYTWMRQRGLILPGLLQGVNIPWPNNLSPQPPGAQPPPPYPPQAYPPSTGPQASGRSTNSSISGSPPIGNS